MDILKRFIESEDLKLLETPIVFKRRDMEFANYLCCLTCPAWFSVIPVFITPYQLACTSVVAKHFDLQLDNHAVQLFEARNDCFCHIAKTRKLIPLDKIQDIQVGQDCIQTCYGVKALSILTGGAGMETAAFLDVPDEVRTGISLAARLVQTKAATAANSMGQGALRGRIAALDGLVGRGALTRDELAAIRVPLLAEERDLSPVLVEAADLRDAGALSPAEFDALKARLLARLR